MHVTGLPNYMEHKEAFISACRELRHKLTYKPGVTLPVATSNAALTLLWSWHCSNCVCRQICGIQTSLLTCLLCCVQDHTPEAPKYGEYVPAVRGEQSVTADLLPRQIKTVWEGIAVDPNLTWHDGQVTCDMQFPYSS